VRANDTVAILEAMKLEIAVRVEPTSSSSSGDGGKDGSEGGGEVGREEGSEDLAGGTVEKVLVRPGDVVKGGEAICLIRRRG